MNSATCLELNVDENKLDDYVIKVKDFCLTNGKCQVTENLETDIFMGHG